MIHAIHLSFLLTIVGAGLSAQPTNDKGRVFVSVDRGANWVRADNGLPAHAIVNAWATTEGIVVAGTEADGIFISTGETKTWRTSSKGLPKGVRILSITFHNNLIFAGTYRHGLFYSDNDGENWFPASKGVANANVRFLYSLERVIFAGTDAGLFISDDAGKTWRQTLIGLQINCIVSDGLHLFVATNRGVLRTNDYGRNWEWIFQDGAVCMLTVDNSDIYLLNYFGRVYKSSREQYAWLRADLFLPFHFTFQITPGGRQFFTTDWHHAIRGLNNTSDFFHANGIPETAVINDLLVTPYGLLAASIAATEK